MACSIIRNKETNEIEKVLAPNGKESILYQSILKIQPDKEEALQSWAQVYTASFKEWFGDWEKSSPVKEGVSQLFDSNPDLASIGTAEQYSAYLDTIFPDSKVKDIVYHGKVSDNPLSKSKPDAQYGSAYYFTSKKKNTKEFGNNVFSAIVNTRNPSYDAFSDSDSFTAKRMVELLADKGYDSIDETSKEYPAQLVLFESEQIHILGSKDDVSGFKEFVSSGTVNQSSKVVDENGEPLLVYHNSPNEFKAFDKSKIASNTSDIGGSQDNVLGFFFTDNQKKLSSGQGFYKLGTNLYSVFLNIRNPDTDVYDRVDDKPILQDPELNEPIFPNYVEEFKLEKEKGVKKGKDGAIKKWAQQTFFIAYEPNQIKSVLNQGTFSKENDDIYLQAEPASEIPSDKQLDSKVTKFLEKIGVSVRSVDVIRDAEGNQLSAIAKASMMNKIIEVINGKADVTTLPEEAAHFFVEMLGENHPLYKQMFEKITSYKLYPVTVEQYRKNPLYRNADGTVNVTKLKKEAMGKLIAQFIVKNEYGTETEAKLKEFSSWWNKLWNYITELFNKAPENPFETAAIQILNADLTGLSEDNLADDEFLQTEGNLDMLIEDQDKIHLDNTIDPMTKQKRHVYYYGEQKARGSVTSVYVDAWLKKIFRSDNRTESQKMIDLEKAQYGDLIHEAMQTIIQSYTNADGTASTVQKPYSVGVPDKVRAALDNYIKLLMEVHPGAKFMTEVKVYDRKTKVAGSIDLVAIDPDGTVNIYDWKSQEVPKGQTDLKSYKDEMYRIQLKNYRDILQLQYGFQKFGKVRAIPMKTSFVFSANKIASIKDLEIGDIDPTKIPDSKNYLLPVVLKNESTNNEQLDELLDKLNGIYDKIANASYTKEQKALKREELARLRTVLRDLHLRKRVNKLIDLGVLEYKKYSKAIEENTLTGKDIMDASKILEVFSQSGSYLHDLMEEYLQAAKDADDAVAVAEFNDTKMRFNSMRANVENLIRNIAKYRDEQARKLAEAEGVENLLDAEAPVGPLNGLFSALSKIDKSSFKTFGSILRKVQNKRDVRFGNMIDDMADLQKNFLDWAGRKGLSYQKAIDMMLDIDENGKWGGNFLAKYSREFYQARDKAIENGDTKWFQANTTFLEDKYLEAYKKQEEFFNSFTYSENALENKAMQTKKLNEWIENHLPVFKGMTNGKAYANKENPFLEPKPQWETQQWKTLNQAENAPLLNVYKYFQTQIKYARKLGMLDRYSPRFIPSIYATKVDQLVFGDVGGVFSGSGIFESLEVDADNKYTPQVDPTDGSIINKIPVYFTRDIGERKEDGTVDYSKKSKDLFKVFALWGSHMYNYEAMESIEDASLVILDAERNKESLVTDMFNNVVMDGGKVKKVNNNERNAKLLEEYVNYYLYDRMSGELKDTKITNPITNKEYSLLKTAQAAMKFFSFKTLALNPISGTAQFVGGTGNASFMAAKGKNFTPAEWANAMLLVTSQDKKAKKALDYFDILLEGTQTKKIDSLSLSPGNKILTEENGYIIQRTMDKAVQYPVAVAMMGRHMIDENGNIVDIEDFVKAKYDYNNTFYNLPEAERKATLAKINEEVGQLKKEKSLLAIGTINEKDKFEIPGLDKESDAFGKFRSKVKAVNKRIIGNSTHDDINNIRTSMLGSALMQFRSWIPEMAEERFAGLKYDSELQQWTYGKMNLFFGELFSKRMPALAKSIITGFGDNAIEAAKEKYEEMKRDAYEKGQKFDITEGEFIDLYLANLRSEMMELMVVLSFAGMVFSVVSLGDDDDDVEGWRRYARRALSKYYNEFAFYYNPVEFTNLVKSPLPVIGLAEDFTRFSTSMAKELYGAGFDQEIQDKAKPSKYFFRMVPVAKEGLLVMATFDDDFRKDWGIRIER